MRQEMVQRLLALNKEFYQSFAKSFSETRGRVQPGVLAAIDQLPSDASILDVGCGNGRLATRLMEQGHRGAYIGIDVSVELLSIAQEQNMHPEAHFIFKDIAESDWSRGLPNSFDRVFSFATLHHLPGDALRESVLATLSDMLKTSGLLVFSVWNFLASDRMRARIVPWERVDIDPQELDPEDHLLDWRRDGYGLRYVHAFSQAELEILAQKTGYRVIDTYFSDGEGGKLGWYHVWQPS